jgi:membrane fusion protein, multidrug efflux system
MKRFFHAMAGLLLATSAGAQAPLPAAPKSALEERRPAAAPAPPAAAQAAKPAGAALECLVEPFMVVNVGSAVDGVLERVTVDRGDVVRRGQVVATLQSGVEAAAVSLSQARVEFARRKVERNEALFEKQLISAQDRDEMVTEARLHEEELKKDKESLKLRTIVSPLDGVVVERRLAPGELIRSDKSVVLRLAQLNPLNVEVIAPAPLFGSVRVGSVGKVSLAPFVPGLHLAKVVVVDRLIDAASGTFGVRLQLPNPNYKIPAGVKCTVEFGG